MTMLPNAKVNFRCLRAKIVVGELDALLTIVTLPVTPPVAAGAKVIFKVAVSLTAMICPVEIPLTLKPGPEMLALATVTLEPPEFVRVAESVLLLPTSTLPKLRLDELGLSVPGTLTISVATALVAVPAELLTTTLNWAPLSELVSEGVV